MNKTTKESLLSAIAEKGITPDITFEHDMLVDKYKCIEEVFLREVFNENYSSNMDTRNLIAHFRDVAAQYDLTFSREYIRVIDALTLLSATIGSLKNGAKGEMRVRQSLERINGKGRVLKNIYLETSAGNAEYDLIVITKKGVFIIEVKYSKSPTYIDHMGNFRHADGTGNPNYNIADALDRKEYILYESLTAELQTMFPRERIHSYLVVIGNTVVENKCRNISVCSSGSVYNKITRFRTNAHEIFTDEQNELADYLLSCNNKDAFAIDLDIERCCADFAAFIQQIDDAVNYIIDDEIYEKPIILDDNEDFTSDDEPNDEVVSAYKHLDKRSLGIGTAIGMAASVAVISLPKLIKNAVKCFK